MAKKALRVPARPKQSEEITRAILDKHAFLMPAGRQSDKVKLLAVRGYFRDSIGKVGANDRGLYDDALFLVSPRGHWSFNFNVDPSRSRKGMASIKSPQAVKYKAGMHGISGKNPYPAFRQAAKCFVTRDGGQDDFGMHWVNLHRGGWTTTSSLGCMTVPRNMWDEVLAKIKAELKAANQKDFYVTLLEYSGGEPPVSIAPAVPLPTPAPRQVASPVSVQPLDETDRNREIEEILEDQDKTFLSSTTNQANVFGAATAGGTILTAVESPLVQALLILIVALCAGYIFYERSRKARAAREVRK